MKGQSWFAVLTLVAGSGCLLGSDQATYPERDRLVLVLEYTLLNLADVDREAFLGPHCATAMVRHQLVEVERRSLPPIGDEPFLVVDAEYARNPGGKGFATLGVGSYPRAFPAVIDPVINRTSSPIATIDHCAGATYIDGEAVVLPHSWTRTSPGDWHADFTLSESPRQVRSFHQDNCA